MNLGDLTDSLRTQLDANTTAREEALTASRNVIRACGNAIRALHRYEMEQARVLLDDAQVQLNRARSSLEKHPDVLYAGFVHDAEKELAEARITYALVTDASLPTPEELGVPPAAFLKGMAESIGELRRHILDLMRRGDLKRGEELLGA